MTTGSTLRRTACPLDCPDSCSLEATVADGRVVRLAGDRRNPYTQGFICGKVAHFAERLYGPDRLLHPARRTGRKGEGRFERISWDDALSEIATRLAEVRTRFGGEAILPYSYGGSNGALTQDTTDARLFRRLGASRLERTVCAAPTGRAALGLYGKMLGVALPDYVEARLIVVWGTNPSDTGIHFVPVVQEAKRRGAKLVVVDPRAIPLARQADLHLAPRPGSDLALALAVVRWLFENGRADSEFLARHATGVEELRRCAAPWDLAAAARATGLEPAAIERLARLWADSSPAVIRCGWGVERNRNGGSAVAAILALPAIAGKFGVRGGGYTMSNSPAWKLDSEAAAAAPEPATRRINMNQLADALLELRQPPVQALFVYNSNAAVTSPDAARVRRGLEREDLFTVVFDQVLTDTARYADIVLPATTFLEHHEVARGYGAYVLHDIQPAVAPVGEARPNYAVFADLVERLGLARPGDRSSAAELRAAVLGDDLAARLDSGIATPPSGARPIQFQDVFPRTADGKIHLVPAELDREAPAGLYGFQEDPATAEFPLALLSPATRQRISSSLGECRREIVPVELAPADAAARGIRDGDRVRVWNRRGEVITRARISPGLRSGVAVLPKGLWRQNSENGATAADLAPDSLADLGGGACFNDARVEIGRA